MHCRPHAAAPLKQKETDNSKPKIMDRLELVCYNTTDKCIKHP